MLPPMSGLLAAIGGLVLAVVTGTLWFRRIQAVALPADRTPFVLAMVAAWALGCLAFALTGNLAVRLLAGLPMGVATVFVVLVAVSPQKGGTGAFRVGEPVPDFTAPDDTGKPFALSRLAGRPLLLKFFRGHW